MIRLRPVSPLCAVLLLAACTTSSGVGPGSQVPSDLNYGTGFLGVVDCVWLPAVTPTVIGDQLSFSVDPPLPQGLTLDPVTGALSGLANAPVGTSFHTVTATNALGSASAGLTIQVSWPAPPQGLSYADPLASYDLGVPIAPNAALLSVAPASQYTYTIQPPLPAGLSLSPSTGGISGTPQEVLGGAPFTIFAQDCVGQSTTTVLWIEVLPAVGSATEPAGYAIANGDGTVSLFEVDPASGAPIPGGYALLGAVPTDLVGSADGTKLFALLSGGSVAALALDGRGNVVELPASPTALPGFSGSGGLVAAPDGRTLYACDAATARVQALSIGDLGSLSPLGAPVSIQGSGSGPQDPGVLAISADSSSLLVLNRASQTLSLIRLLGDGSLGAQSAVSTGNGPTDVVLGRLLSGQTFAYVINSIDATVSVYRVDLAEGTLVPIQTHPLPAGSVPTRLSFVEHHGTRFVYVAKTATQLLAPLPVNPSNGTLSGPFVAFSAPGVSEIAFSPGGDFGLVLSAAQNLATGVAIVDDDGSLAASKTPPLDCTRLRAAPVAAVAVGASSAKTRRSKQVYAASGPNGVLLQYRFTPESAQLEALNPAQVAFGSSPFSSAVARSGSFVIASDALGFSGPDLYLFGDQAGFLAGQSASDLGALFGGSVSGAGDVGIEPSDRFAYVLRAGQPGALHGFRVSSGQLVSPTIGGTGNGPAALALDPLGRFAFVANRLEGLVTVHSIDPGSGQVALITAQGVGSEPTALATDAGGCFLFVLHAGNGNLRAYRINPNSGVLGFLGESAGASADAQALAVDPRGQLLVVADTNAGLIRRYRFSDGSDGALPGVPMLVGSTPAGGIPSDLAFDALGQALVVSLSDSGQLRTYQVQGLDLVPRDSDPAGPSVTGLSVRSVLE